MGNGSIVFQALHHSVISTALFSSVDRQTKSLNPVTGLSSPESNIHEDRLREHACS